MIQTYKKSNKKVMETNQQLDELEDDLGAIDFAPFATVGFLLLLAQIAIIAAIIKVIF